MDAWDRGWERDQEIPPYQESPESSICCGHPQTTQADEEKTPALTGQEDGENDFVLVKWPQNAGIKYTVFWRRKKTKKSKKIINPRKLETVLKKLSQVSKILKKCFLINVYCLFKNRF